MSHLSYSTSSSHSNNNMMATPYNNKDPVKIVYLDVSFQGQQGGRLALRSRSMTFFTSSGEPKGNIAWNAIAKIQTGATRNASEETCLLKVVNHFQQSLTFRMKDESDLDKIRQDVQNSMNEYRSQAPPDDKPPSPAAGFSVASSEDDSLTCFPRFEDEYVEVGSGSGIFSRSGSVPNNNSNHRDSAHSVNTRNTMTMQSAGSTAGASVATGASNFRDEEESLLAYYSNNNDKGDVAVVQPGGEASSMASTAAGSVHSNAAGSVHSHSSVIDGDGAGSIRSKRSSIRTMDHQAVKTFREEDYAMPVASFRLVPEGNEAYYHPKPGDGLLMTHEHHHHQKRQRWWRSKWFWIPLLLILLLLIGIAIGMPVGIFSANNKDTNKNNPNQVVALEDTTPSDTSVQEETDPDPFFPNPTPSPSEAFVAAVERTNPPTSSPAPSLAPTAAPSTPIPTTDECHQVGHDEPMNYWTSAVDAGSFGGSSYCRASIVSLCEWTKWIPFNTFQGVGNAWFKATAVEDSFCVADIEHQIQLRVPPGVDYDLHVYHFGTDVPQDSSTVAGSNGNTEVVIISGDDATFSDQSFVYFVQIEFKEGSSCEPWTVTFSGHQCGL